MSRQLTSPSEYLPTDRHIIHYISQKYINSIHIRNKCYHVWVCNVVILKMYTVNITEVTHYVSVFHLPCLSHTTLFYPLINDLCNKLQWGVQFPISTRHSIFFNIQGHNQKYGRNFAWNLRIQRSDLFDTTLTGNSQIKFIFYFRYWHNALSTNFISKCVTINITTGKII
jgi:hypothetical protein